MLLYTLLLIPVSLSPYFAHIAGPFYLGAAAVLGTLFLLCCIRVMASAGIDKPAKQMFAFSILIYSAVCILIADPSDSQPDPLDDMHGAVEYARKRKLRGRNIALFLVLLLWVLVIYIGFMVKIHTELHGQ